MQAKLDKLNLILDEGLTGVRVVRAFDRVDHEEKRFDEANLDLTNVAIRVNQIIASLMPIMMLVLNLSSVAILWFGGIRINNGDMQIGASDGLPAICHANSLLAADGLDDVYHAAACRGLCRSESTKCWR